MLDFGFSEILLTSAIALVVLGPERLPKVARQVGNWMGRARAMARQLSDQLEREVSADELLRAHEKAASAMKRIALPQATACETQAPPSAPTIADTLATKPPPVAAADSHCTADPSPGPAAADAARPHNE